MAGAFADFAAAVPLDAAVLYVGGRGDKDVIILQQRLGYTRLAFFEDVGDAAHKSAVRYDAVFAPAALLGGGSGGAQHLSQLLRRFFRSLRAGGIFYLAGSTPDRRKGRIFPKSASTPRARTAASRAMSPRHVPARGLRAAGDRLFLL